MPFASGPDMNFRVLFVLNVNLLLLWTKTHKDDYHLFHILFSYYAAINAIENYHICAADVTHANIGAGRQQQR